MASGGLEWGRSVGWEEGGVAGHARRGEGVGEGVLRSPVVLKVAAVSCSSGRYRSGLSLVSAMGGLMDGRAGRRFLNAEYAQWRRRQQRRWMAKLRSSRQQKKPAVMKKPSMMKKPSVMKKPSMMKKPCAQPSGNRHRVYPCCGRRKDRCLCDWSVVEARLNSAELADLKNCLRSSELRYAKNSVFPSWLWHAFDVYIYIYIYIYVYMYNAQDTF